MILHRVRSLHNYGVQVLVLWIRAIDEPSRLTVEIASVEDPLPVTLDDCLSAARNVPRVYQSHRAVANIGRLLVLKIPLMLEHSLQMNVLVACTVATQVEKVLDDQVGQIEHRLNAVERHATSNVEDRRRANMIKMSMSENDRLHLLRWNMHREAHVMVHHHTIV